MYVKVKSQREVGLSRLNNVVRGRHLNVVN